LQKKGSAEEINMNKSNKISNIEKANVVSALDDE
jgi:hypothetical protein